MKERLASNVHSSLKVRKSAELCWCVIANNYIHKVAKAAFLRKCHLAAAGLVPKLARDIETMPSQH